MRIYSTLKITRSDWYDDVATVLASVFSLTYVGLVIHIRDRSRHGWDLPVTAITTGFMKTTLAGAIASASGIALSKVSILLLLYRLFHPNKTLRYLVFVCLLWAILVSCTSIVVSLALCVPRPGESFDSLQVPLRCSHQSIWAVIQGSLNVILDILILCIPIPIVCKLKLETRKKVGVLAIFTTGFIACLASVLTLIFKVKLMTSPDVVWNSFRVHILNLVELNAAIMVACMPACASFFRFLSNESESMSSLKIRLSSARSSMNIFREKHLKHKSTSSMDTAIESPACAGHGSMNADGRYRKPEKDVLSDKACSRAEWNAGWQRSIGTQTDKSDCERWPLQSDHEAKTEL
ncbi:hypothetical protein XANCAGTX0491_000606 [Xanthoria calcicola]